MALFISYRRDDAAGYARAVHDALVQRFGAGQVFMDVVDIGGGQRFDAVIRRSLAASQVLLVLIGPRWQGGGEPPRLHDPADFVHQEIAAALAQRLMVMPLLLDGTPMPAEATLPPPLQALARCNALALDNSRFNADIERLAATLAPLLRAQPRRGWLLGGGATLLLAAGGAAVWLWPRPPQRPAVNGRWRATVDYDWPGAHHNEVFEFSGDGEVLAGSASFLGVPRPLAEGRIDARGELLFSTRSGELGSSSLLHHRYRGRLVGETLQLQMQTERNGLPDKPLAISARRG